MSQTYEEPLQSEPKPQDGRLRAAAGRQAVLDIAIRLGLILSILAVYAQVRHFDFINYDDPAYVSVNPHVQAGLTPAGVKWAATAVVVSNWVPVTMLSHMLAAQFFGMTSGMHHLVNVLFHALAALLLFGALRRATGSLGASAFVAGVFALHPVHVESVVWIAERKDVLSACFLFWALYAYVRYTEQPGLRRYVLILVPFSLGLMSKPMLVTFPFLLLLFDVWPLRRVQWPRTLWEKLPLFALSAGASAVTFWIQRRTGVVNATPFTVRIENALLSYITYIGQMFWPARLAVFYPYPHSVMAWQGATAFAILLAVSIWVILEWRTRPYLTVGWFWYLGTLVPVIGFVQVGYQARADRYTYLPMVGLAIMLAWGGAAVVGKWPGSKSAIAAAATLYCAVCMVLAWKQTGYWQNSGTLFQHALNVTDDNWVAHGNLGLYLMNKEARRADAIGEFEAALRIKPEYPEANNNLGACLMFAGLCPAAIPHFEATLRQLPNDAGANKNLGVCLIAGGRTMEAIPHLETFLRVRPNDADTHLYFGLTLSKIPGRQTQAIAEYTDGLRLKPDVADAQQALGVLLQDRGRTEEAIRHFEAADRLHPGPELEKMVDRLRAGAK